MAPTSPLPAEAEFEAHLARYLAVGHDRLQAVRFVADAARDTPGPALDIGTGKGLLAIQLALAGRDVTSIDVSPVDQQLAAARAVRFGVGDRIRFVLGDAARLPFDAASFGLLAMMNVLHHLDEAEPVLGEMCRVLAPGGRILIGEFDAEGFALVDRIHREEGRHHPVGPVTMDVARAWLRAHGHPAVAHREGCLHEVALFA